MIDEISVVIPAYNEVENIERVVREIIDTLERLFPKYELIVVDDGSTDGTDRVIRNLSLSCRNLKLISFECNKGYGVALREGFKRASNKFIFYTDSDGQYDIREIESIMPLMNGCDMVAGFRIKREDNIVRRLHSKVYNRFTSLYLGLNLRDINCSFKLFKREIIDMIDLRSNGFSIDAELVWKTIHSGFRVCQQGVGHRKRDKGSSKVRLTDSVLTLRELFSIKKQK